MIDFNFKITCLKCNHTFNRYEAKKVMVTNPILNIQYPEDICPNCEQWLSNCRTYHDDGSIASVGGGSGVAIFKQGTKWPE